MKLQNLSMEEIDRRLEELKIAEEKETDLTLCSRFNAGIAMLNEVKAVLKKEDEMHEKEE